MPEVLASRLIPADAEAVWRVVRDFDGLPTWHPAIARSALRDDARSDQVGAIRVLGLAGDDGGEVIEVLVGLDDRARALTYEIVESPFPVRLYRSTIRVVPVTTSGESFVEWGWCSTVTKSMRWASPRRSVPGCSPPDYAACRSIFLRDPTGDAPPSGRRDNRH